MMNNNNLRIIILIIINKCSFCEVYTGLILINFSSIFVAKIEIYKNIDKLMD